MVVSCHIIQNLCIIRNNLSWLFWPQKLPFNRVQWWQSDGNMYSYSMLLRPRLVKDERSSDLLFHHGPAGTSLEWAVSWPRYSPPRPPHKTMVIFTYKQLYQVSASEALSLLWRSQSPFTKPVRPFWAPGPVPFLGERSHLGFLSLGILPVCTLFTGSTT